MPQKKKLSMDMCTGSTDMDMGMKNITAMKAAAAAEIMDAAMIMRAMKIMKAAAAAGMITAADFRYSLQILRYIAEQAAGIVIP